MADLKYMEKQVYDVSLGADVYKVYVSLGAGGTTASSGVYNVLDYGAAKDGTTDDAASIQAAIDACEAAGGGTVLLPAGTYSIESSLTCDSDGVIISAYGATLSAASTVDAMIEFSSADNCAVVGLAAVGDETLVGYNTGDMVPVVQATSCNNLTVRDMAITARSGGVLLTTCADCHVENVRLVGFLTETTSSAGTASIEVSGGGDITITGCRVSDHGCCVLVGADATDVRVDSCYAEDVRDNGFYFSSGNYNTITGCTVENCDSSSGIKMRGSYNTVSGNSIRGCVVGVSATGNGVTGDDDGCNGEGTVVSGNSIADCVTYGVYLDLQDSLASRNFSVVGNTIVGTPTTTATGNAIRARSTTNSPALGHVISNNTIKYDTDVTINDAIHLLGVSGAEMEGIVVSGNSITGNGTNLPYGIWGNYVLNSSIYGNSYRTIATSNVLLNNSSGNTLYVEGADVSASWDGHTELSDTAYTDLVIAPSNFKIPASSNPTEITWLTDLKAYSFATGEYIHLDGIQLPHGYSEGTDLLFHVHFVPAADITDGEVVRFTLTYTVTSPFYGFPATDTVTTDFTNDATWRAGLSAGQAAAILSGTTVASANNPHIITTSGTISGAGLNLSSVLAGKVEYTASGTTYTGEAIVTSMDFHYQINRLGSENEFTG